VIDRDLQVEHATPDDLNKPPCYTASPFDTNRPNDLDKKNHLSLVFMLPPKNQWLEIVWRYSICAWHFVDKVHDASGENLQLSIDSVGS
jgi:hypothetical protein